MEAPQTNQLNKLSNLFDLQKIERDVTPWDEAAYHRVVSHELTPEQEEVVVTPPEVRSLQEEVFAIHWHREFVPLELLRRRIDAMFPNRQKELLIPTDHNVLNSYDEFTGVEVDCYSPEFAVKVQLLIHFESKKLETPRSDVFKSMLEHTFKYRSSQLFSFLETLVDPAFEERLQEAARKTGATQELIEFVKIYAHKVSDMVDRFRSQTPPMSLKNKVIRDYFNALREHYDDHLIDRAQVFLKAVKKIVKRSFKLEYFYHTQEVIEEVRALGGGIVIPHPEQFWPVLLAGYDIDGIEVWNPQSREYTHFLIDTVLRENKTRSSSDRPVLIFMGDDCHMSEKVPAPERQDAKKASRQVGYQPAWDDPEIRKTLIVANCDRKTVIEEYRNRLLG